MAAVETSTAKGAKYPNPAKAGFLCVLRIPQLPHVPVAFIDLSTQPSAKPLRPLHDAATISPNGLHHTPGYAGFGPGMAKQRENATL